MLARVQAGDLHRIVSVARDGSARPDASHRRRAPPLPRRGRRGARSTWVSRRAPETCCAFRTSGGVPERLADDAREPRDDARRVPGRPPARAGGRGRPPAAPRHGSGGRAPAPSWARRKPTFPPVALAPSGVVAFLTGASGAPPQLGDRLRRRRAAPQEARASRGDGPGGARRVPRREDVLFRGRRARSPPSTPRPERRSRCARATAWPATRRPTRSWSSATRPRACSSSAWRSRRGVETPILVTGPLKLAPAPLAQGAIGPDRRILVAAISPGHVGSGSRAPRSGARARVTAVPVSYDGEIVATAWGRGGLVLGMGLGSRGEFWSLPPARSGRALNVLPGVEFATPSRRGFGR